MRRSTFFKHAFDELMVTLRTEHAVDIEYLENDFPMMRDLAYVAGAVEDRLDRDELVTESQLREAVKQGRLAYLALTGAEQEYPDCHSHTDAEKDAIRLLFTDLGDALCDTLNRFRAAQSDMVPAA